MHYLFLKYNNYYNRRIKFEGTLDNYIAKADDSTNLTDNFNFQEGDLVNTQITINWDEDWNPDYLVCYDDEEEPIRHRWFVIDWVRIRRHQYQVTLRRDLLADDYYQLQNNIYNIDRCTVPTTSKLIYNKEPFEYNQIKTKEIPLYDETLCPWIVGYLPTSQAITGDIATSDNYDIDLNNIPHTEWDMYQYVDKELDSNANIATTEVCISFARSWWVGGYEGGYAIQGPGTSSFRSVSGEIGTANEVIRYSNSTYTTVKNANRKNWMDWDYINTLITNEFAEYFTPASIIQELQRFNGNKIRFNDGIYKIYFTKTGIRTNTKTKLEDNVANYVIQQFQNHYSGDIKHNFIDYTFTTSVYKLNMVKVESSKSIHYSIPATAHNLSDAPYKMFCMPYPAATEKSPKIYIDWTPVDRNIIDLIYSDIIKKSTTGTGTDTLYDVQLLPYCPLKFKATQYVPGRPETTGGPIINSYNNLTMPTNWRESIEYTAITLTTGSAESYGGYIFFPDESNFNFTINTLLANDELKNCKDEFEITDKKVQNETEFIRICSPNYSGVFEMTPAKNDGIDSFNVSCTYKPFNPFILVAPNFSELYGADFKDSRGLICTGDFSLPIVNSAWTQYQLTNKTYQETFNREISHMEVGQQIQRIQQGVGMVTGAASAATSGAIGGAMLGGPVGAVVGGAVSGAASLAGGVADFALLGKQQKEDISYAKDMFNFNLQNIRALPNSLAKTSALNANSKYVPFVEKYDATAEEKKLLKQYMEYNGMTAGFCGELSQLQGFVRANIIKYNGTMEAHEVNAMNTELMKGVYFE